MLKRPVFLLLLISACFSFNLTANMKKDSRPVKNVLMIVSYHMTHVWSSQLSNSIIENTKNLPVRLFFNVVSLDALRTRDAEAWEKEFQKYLPSLKNGKYAMIVTLDDMALNLVLRHYKELPSDLPIVFAGYENYHADMKKKYPNLTGVTQEFRTEDSIRSALRMFPKIKEVILLSDSSESSRKFESKLKGSLPKFEGVNVSYMNSSGRNIHAVLKPAEENKKDSMILLCPWRGLHENDYQTVGAFGVDLSRITKMPFLISEDSLIGYGGLGGYITRSEEHGKEAANLIRDVFAAGGARNIPVISGTVRPVFDYNILMEQNVKLSDLPPHALLLNKPQTLWQHYSEEILFITLIVLILLAGILVYAYIARRTLKRAKLLYGALPGRVGVLNRAEKILYIHAEDAEDGIMKARTLQEIPDTDYQKLSNAFQEVFRTGKKVALDYEFRSVKRFMSIAPLPRILFGEEAAVWFSHDNSALQNALRQAEIYAEENKKNLQKLEKSTQLWNIVTNSLPMPIFAKDADHDFRYVFANLATQQFLGLTEKELIGKCDAELHPPEKAESILKDDKETMQIPDRGFENVITVTDQHGKSHFMRTVRRAFIAPDGNRLLLAAMQDITELENARREAEALNNNLNDLLTFHNILLDNMPAYVYTKDIDSEYRYTSCNRACEKLFGISIENVIGKNDYEMFGNRNSEEINRFRDSDQIAAQKDYITEEVLPFTSAAGEKRIGKFHRKRLDLSGGRHWLFGLCIDITELLEAKQCAEEVAEQFRLTIQSIGDAVLVTDREGRVTLLNGVGEHLTGVSQKDAVGKTHEEIFRIVSALDDNPVPSPVRNSLASGRIVDLANHTDLLSANGKRYHIADSSAPIFNHLKEIIGAILVFRDVTDAYEKRDQLRTALTSLEYASEMTQTASFRYNLENNERFGSKLLEELWPCRNGKPLSQKEWIYPDDLERVNLKYKELESGKVDSCTFEYRSNYNGSMRYYRSRISVDRSNPRGLQLVGVIQDVTEIIHNTWKLKETLELWDVVINSIPFVFFAKNPEDDFRYVLCNRAFEELVGKTKEEIIGKNDAELFMRPEDAMWFRSKDTAAMNSKDGEVFEEVCFDFRGQKRMFKTLKKPFTGVDGRRMLLGACSDIMELNEFIANERVVNSCLETFFSAGDLASVGDAVLEIICKHMNATRCYMLSFDTKKFTASGFAEYAAPGKKRIFTNCKDVPFSPEESWYQKFLRKEVITSTNLQGNLELIGSWGVMASENKMESLYVAGIYLDGELWGDLGLIYEEEKCEDFSNLNLNFLKSAAHLLELMLERKRSQEQILSAMHQAQAANKAKSFFIASVSHEIRTPLNAVIGFAELLRDSEMDRNIQKDYLNSIAYSGNALLQLINDVLDLSKMEADQMKILLEPTDFESIGNEVMQMFTHRVQGRRLSLIVDLPTLPIMYLDRLRIRQILFNLIGNAVKFTNAGSIRLRAEFTKTGDLEGTFQFSVSDTGIGIAEEDKGKLLEPFVQLSGIRGTNATNNGTGLGLSISKRLAEKMGGELWMETKLDHGSTFGVRLFHVHLEKQVRATSPEPQVPENAGSSGIKSTSILLVDDVSMNLKVMKAMAFRCGASKVVSVSSGAAALEALEKESFDLLLTDIWMPDMNGAELAERIRKDSRFQNLPIGAVTADVEFKDNFPLDNFNFVLFKPVSSEKMKKIMNMPVRPGVCITI